jgi:N-acetyl-alpha-D-muramate 1-phosphate uridylyltransferase
MQAMIFAAGLGTRLRPLTNTKPKALVEINGKTLLERNVEKMLSYGIKRIVVNIHHFPTLMIEAIEKIEKKYDCQLIISDERDLLLDTGGGLLKAKKYFFENDSVKKDNIAVSSNDNSLTKENLSTTSEDDLILLHNVDILSDIDFMEMKKEFLNTNPIALLAVKNRQTKRYFVFNESNVLSGWTNIETNESIMTRNCEKKQLFAFSGVHLVRRKIFDLIEQKGVFSIKDTYLQLSCNQIIKPFVHEGKWLDVGRIEAIEKAEKMF